uniref:TPM domain-containing protein n=1 Tax=Craspedostauros australis TaxID=1486917 RepID=A0A7R9ZR25_9STRA|mmetsp:Transcript_655/g.1843  ORF Transcript_655/g.1843 Transcript_655/m.1843 type:complete len:335 (+) Transcript_655:119-1123(+)|eukprot:CAMPEP_0198109880 /NCGR_PEP_ID=MMETSP1442-20131203/1925_1 /TAXON_ID= /ORGANISM="Craspedostauros australis, Strain CCMP3328" /LENGTH=334 /DNA_ID=CAMNT_0043765719 /DNA_START=93 /DNA_END=1097 /DNA_ORIENTATION=+
MKVFNLIPILLAGSANAFVPASMHSRQHVVGANQLQLQMQSKGDDNANNEDISASDGFPRRAFLSTMSAATAGILSMIAPNAALADDDESFASIAARASKLSSREGERSATPQFKTDDTRTMYDFSVPVQGRDVPLKELIRQEYDEEGFARVKAVLVVNMKQDDPIARKDIPELMSLASKYGRSGEFVVMLSPSDQGYYEPDTSALIRLKLASEYGYGINPATILTDKVNFLGTGAHPFWRWLQKNCRTPAGLGRIEGNFEKFLVDARTGVPLRRYPRKYLPTYIKNDIEAIVSGKPLPPAVANYQESWRAATAEAERDTYRFQKGLNYFDQQP